jgi:hypothetical protein
MNDFFKHLLQRLGHPGSLLADAPGPSPWYIHEHRPDIPGHRWEAVDIDGPHSGKVVLHGPAGPVLIADFYHWMTVIENSLLLIWYQPYVLQEPTPPVEITVLDPARLEVLQGDISTLCDVMKTEKRPLFYEGAPVAKCELATTEAEQPIHRDFPVPVNRIEELLILCHSFAVVQMPASKTSGLALLVAQPAKATYQLYGQDWFNDESAMIDFGYQWVTRVVRHPRTGRIYGDGIRLKQFVLDKSLHKIR